MAPRNVRQMSNGSGAVAIGPASGIKTASLLSSERRRQGGGIASLLPLALVGAESSEVTRCVRQFIGFLWT